MARNPVQFQKGISLNAFLSLYGSEDQCFDALFQWRWPSGFLCPHCAHDRCCQLNTRKFQQYNRCHRQTSITAGTIFDSTKLPLTVWFQGLYFMIQDKIRCIGDDAAPPARRQARTGAPGKTPFVAAFETNEQEHPLRVTLTVVEGFRLTEIAAWAQQHLSPGTQVLSDGPACFNGVTAAGCVHESMVTGGGKAAVERPEFRWVNTILGNIKTALRGAYHAVRPKYAQRYLAEVVDRFNRRFDLPEIIPGLVYVALRTPPMPERLLKLRLA